MNNSTSAWFSRSSSKVIRRAQKLYTISHKLNTCAFQQLCKRWSYLPDIHFWQPDQIATVWNMKTCEKGIIKIIYTIETEVPPDNSSYNMGLNTNLSDWSTRRTCNLCFFISKLLQYMSIINEIEDYRRRHHEIIRPIRKGHIKSHEENLCSS